MHGNGQFPDSGVVYLNGRMLPTVLSERTCSDSRKSNGRKALKSNSKRSSSAEAYDGFEPQHFIFRTDF